MLTIVGQGLVGTLAALEALRRGIDFRVVDLGSGASATRAAAGLFNPLTGPRFTPDENGWDEVVPFYRSLEDRLGVELVHEIPLLRPLRASKATPDSFPRSAPGWTARLDDVDNTVVRIDGGGWVDLDALLNAVRDELRRRGRLEERTWAEEEGRGRNVLWCAGMPGLQHPAWSKDLGPDRWQGVRGDVLTVRIPGWPTGTAEIGARFLLPLGGDQFRWGATHESDVIDYERRPEALETLVSELRARLGHAKFEVVDHRWGVRPASRNRQPLVVRHTDEVGWTAVNGFGGRGVVQAPRTLSAWFDGQS